MKTTKKVLSLLLSVIMLLSCCSLFSFAAQADDYDHYPQIFATGFVSANIYYEDDPEQKPLFYPIDTDRLLGNLGNTGDYILNAVKNKNPDLLYEFLYGFLMDGFAMLRLGKDGATNEPGVVTDELKLAYDGDGKYTFYYDSRLSPLDIVPQLYEYIQWVKEDSGYDKVELTGSSYGAIVVTTYLDVYSHCLDDIDSVLLVGSPVKGVPFIGELFTGEMKFNSENLQDFVSMRLGTEGLGLILDAMNEAGILQPLLDAGLTPVLNRAIMDAVVAFGRDALCTVPAAWTVVPSENMEAALVNMFGENYKDADHEYAVLIDKIIRYHETVALRPEEIILSAKQENDLHVALFAKYGIGPLPIGSKETYADDGFVTLGYASYGATSGLYGAPLDKDYKQALYPEYNLMSGDGCIDASTGILPFNTWFLKGFEHSQKNAGYYELFNDVIYNNLDVFSDPEWPQFLQMGTEDPEALVPVPVEEPDYDEGFFRNFISYIKSLFEAVIAKITGTFKK